MTSARFHVLLLLLMPLAARAGLDQPWQKLSDPTASEAAAVFPAPPPEYSAHFTWGIGGSEGRDSIARDLDGMKALHVRAAIIEPNSGMRDAYLSAGYFKLVRLAVEEAKKRDMRLWIMDDGDYPSGLAGGKFTMERPELRMKALAASERMQIPGGTTFSWSLTPDVICAVAVNRTTHETRALDIRKNTVEWEVPEGDWELVTTRYVYRSGPTRSANNPTGAKDLTHSLMDYLDPAANRLFKDWTFEAYRKVIGDEFGKTVLGFRGDEPAYNFNPWTPKFLEEFQQRKGYDLRPYVGFFGTTAGWRNAALTPEQRRAYADYCDVWSDLFRDNFFNMEAEWCAKHGLEMQCHIEHEEILPQLAMADGDFFKCFREIQIPGIDIIWHQIWMDNPADFPKLASSAAHLYGRPRAMCEAFAAYRPPPDLREARWLLDFLMVRGINRIEYMFWPGSGRRNRGPARPATTSGTNTVAGPATNAAAPGTNAFSGFRGNRYYRDPGFPAVADYVNRVCYLLGEGRPAAQVGLYIPSSSFWLADAAQAQLINTNLLTLAHQLIEHQQDFDFVDEQALSSSVLTLKGRELVNLSGQGYRAVIVPPSLAISRKSLERLQAFAAAGGRVIFIGPGPAMVSDKTILHAGGPADIAWATLHETDVGITRAVLDNLPAPDFVLDRASPLVSYNHRRLRDADVYFVFNSGDEKASVRATLAGSGSAQVWDANTGKITALNATPSGENRLTAQLDIQPWTTRIVVLGSRPAAVTRP